MSFIENFTVYKNRVLGFQDSFKDMTEEATKNALVMPFFSMMGYDVFNPSEFIPEFVCDVGTKKGEKIDYAIMHDNEPIMLIEAKRAGMKLQKQQHSQLFRYFSVNRSRIAILTNGIQYNIYSDIDSPNVMDNEPFFAFNILEDDESLYLQSLEQFTKKNFDIKSILSKAVYLKYAKVVEKTILKDFDNPSDELVKYFLTQPEIKPNHRITSQMIEKYREITAKTIRKMMGITITNSVPKTPISNDIEAVVGEIVAENLQNVESTQTSANPQRTGPSSVEQLKSIVISYNYQCKEEDTPTFLRLHIYNPNGQKLGIVKVAKPDMNNLQFKKLGNPTPFEIASVEEIKNYL